MIIHTSIWQNAFFPGASLHANRAARLFPGGGVGFPAALRGCGCFSIKRRKKEAFVVIVAGWMGLSTLGSSCSVFIARKKEEKEDYSRDRTYYSEDVIGSHLYGVCFHVFSCVVSATELRLIGLET